MTGNLIFLHRLFSDRGYLIAQLEITILFVYFYFFKNRWVVEVVLEIFIPIISCMVLVGIFWKKFQSIIRRFGGDFEPLIQHEGEEEEEEEDTTHHSSSSHAGRGQAGGSGHQPSGNRRQAPTAPVNPDGGATHSTGQQTGGPAAGASDGDGGDGDGVGHSSSTPISKISRKKSFSNFFGKLGNIMKRSPNSHTTTGCSSTTNSSSTTTKTTSSITASTTSTQSYSQPIPSVTLHSSSTPQTNPTYSPYLQAESPVEKKVKQINKDMSILNKTFSKLTNIIEKITPFTPVNKRRQTPTNPNAPTSASRIYTAPVSQPIAPTSLAMEFEKESQAIAPSSSKVYCDKEVDFPADKFHTAHDASNVKLVDLDTFSPSLTCSPSSSSDSTPPTTLKKFHVNILPLDGKTLPKPNIPPRPLPPPQPKCENTTTQDLFYSSHVSSPKSTNTTLDPTIGEKTEEQIENIYDTMHGLYHTPRNMRPLPPLPTSNVPEAESTMIEMQDLGKKERDYYHIYYHPVKNITTTSLIDPEISTIDLYALYD